MVEKVLMFVLWLFTGLLAELLVIGGAAGILLLLALNGVAHAALLAVIVAGCATVVLVVWMMHWREILARKGLLW